MGEEARFDRPYSVAHDGQDTLFISDSNNGQLRQMSIASGETKLFLGVFSGAGHENHGMSADWADLDKFSARALQVFAERFEIAQPPVLLPPPTPNPGLN